MYKSIPLLFYQIIMHKVFYCMILYDFMKKIVSYAAFYKNKQLYILLVQNENNLVYAVF